MNDVVRIDQQHLDEVLPEALKAALIDRQILCAWHAQDGKRIVLWLVDQAINNSVEVEWSIDQGRLLGDEERCVGLAQAQVIACRDPGVCVVRSERLCDQTHRLCEVFQVSSLTAEFAEFTGEQSIYSPVRSAAHAFLEQRINQARFPSTYARWDRDEKISYWTQFLYRGRRWCGESGQPEDAAFGPDVIVHMKKTDGQIERLLPDILRRIARMDSLDPRHLALSFSERTGCHVEVT
jgi:hypothetical protein